MLVHIAARNLSRGWRRSLAVVGSIVIGLAGCMILVGWSRGFAFQMADNAVRSDLATIAIQARGYQANPDPARTLPAPPDEVLALADGRAGVWAAPRLRAEGLVQSARNSSRGAIVGVDPAREPGVSVIAEAIVAGSYLENGTPRGRQLPPVLLGTALAERLRVGLGDKVVLRVPGESGIGAYRVRGLYRTGSSAFDRIHAYVLLEDAMRLLDTPGRVTEIAFFVDRSQDSLALRDQLRAELDLDAFEVLHWSEREPRLAVMIDLMDQMGWILYGFIFVGMAFGIANAILMSVYERMREFGLLRSLGLGSRRLLEMVLLEAVLLTGVGTVLGLVIGWALVTWMGTVGMDLSMFSEGLRRWGIGTTIYPSLTLDDAITPLLLAVGTGLVAGLWPASKAVRLRPAEALRAT
ncbi:MAG: ABC transporter permease [Myxococcales bacterium]|nr:ABC transporter permease [Myxococcales bacterium]